MKFFEEKAFEFSFDLWGLIQSYLLLFLVFAWMPKGQKRFSDLGLQVLFVVGFVPISSFYAWGQAGWIWFYTCTTFFLLIVALTRALGQRGTSSSPVHGQEWFSEYDLGAFLLLIPVATILLIGNLKGFFFNMDLTAIYGIREDFVEVQRQVPFGGYFMNWGGKVVFPFMFLLALFGRRGIHLGLLVISGALLLLFFSLTGHKSYLFLPLMGIGFAVLIKNGHFFRDLLGGVLLVVVICFLYYAWTGGTFLGNIFIKRIFFVPAKISWFYHQYFQEDFLYLSHSLFRGITEYPMNMKHSRFIAELFMGVDSNANNGIFSDGLKNFGILGMYLWGVLIAFLLKVCDLVSTNKRSLVVWSLLLTGIYTLINGQLFPVLLTHGLLLSLMIAFLYPQRPDHEA